MIPRVKEVYRFPKKVLPEIESALRQVSRDYRDGKIASFMVDEEAEGMVRVELIEEAE